MIFGTEDFKYIAGNPGPNSASMQKEKRIEEAIEYLKTIRTRSYVTVPPVDRDFVLSNGKKMNIVLGNFSNMINLTYGERTGSCMRIGGAGKSLYDFCLKDENGFHIRFSNPKNSKFISRVSGFRNGNTVFLNELRYAEDIEYTNKDVVEACKLIANELIELTKDSPCPIENVVISPYYSMEESNMPVQKSEIQNPQQGLKNFYTDIRSKLIVLSTTSQTKNIVTPKLGLKNVPKYPVARDKKNILYNKAGQEYLAHLKSLDQILSGVPVEELDISVDEKVAVCLVGEDWCVTIDKEGHIEKYIMNNTNNEQAAITEVQAALQYVKENLEKELVISNTVSLRM